MTCLHGENFTSDSRILVNRDSCLRDTSDACIPGAGLQTTFRSSTLLEASIPPPFFTRAGELRINVITGNEIANNTGVIKVAQVSVATAQPGQTATIESNAPFDLRPPMQYRLQSTNTSPQPLQFVLRTDPLEILHYLITAQLFGEGAISTPPSPPIPTITFTGVAISAAPSTGLADLSNLSLSFAPNAASFIGQDGAGLAASATIIANDGASLIGQDGAGIISGGAGNIISNDGASIISGGGGNSISEGIRRASFNGGSARETADGGSEIPRRGYYVFRDASGGNGDIQVTTLPDGNPSLTANLTLTQNTFPRITDLSSEVVFSVALNPGLLQFERTAYTASEGEPRMTVTVTRTGDTSQAASVDYITTSSAQPAFGATAGTASSDADYASVSGTLYFAPGETSKTFDVSIIDDSYGGADDANETFNLILNNAQGAAVSGTGAVRVTITDNDANSTSPNATDSVNSFVRQHYLDFLDREPEAEGFAYWTGILNGCGDNRECLNRTRIEVSSRFFLETEFQQTGYYVMRLWKAAYGRFPTYQEFITDRRQVQNNEASQRAFATQFALRAEFQAMYGGLTNAQFVERLYDTANLRPYTSERVGHTATLDAGTKTRADVLREVVERAEFKTREFNPAFVRMQYFGYLRRDVEPEGEAYWINVVTNLSPNNYRAMICSFLNSAEYQRRFGAQRGRFTELDCSSLY